MSMPLHMQSCGKRKQKKKRPSEAKAPCNVGIQCEKKGKKRDVQHQSRASSVVEPAVRVGAENAGTDSRQGFGLEEFETLLKRVIDRDLAVPANDPNTAVPKIRLAQPSVRH